jgi:hypothetical protein
MAERVRTVIEADGDRLADLHLWRLGPGHLGAILSIVRSKPLLTSVQVWYPSLSPGRGPRVGEDFKRGRPLVTPIASVAWPRAGPVQWPLASQWKRGAER